MALHESTIQDQDSPDPLERIRRNIAILMTMRGIRSIEALAVACGYGKSRFYDRFNGKRPEWKASELVSVASALRVTIGDLFEDPDEQFDPKVRTGSR
jgi:hypothetical protein